MTPFLLLWCGCQIDFHDNEIPICQTHGPQAVARAVGMPPPRIRGVATGPHVQTMDLPAWTGRLAGNEKTDKQDAE